MIHKIRKLAGILEYSLAALGMAAALTACGIGSGGSLDATGGASEVISGFGEESGSLHYCTTEELGVPYDRLSAVVDFSGYTLADLSGCGYDHAFSGAETEELREQLEKLDCVDARELHIYKDYAGWSLVLQLDYRALREEMESYYADLDTENMTTEDLEAAIPPEAMDAYWDKIQRYPRIEFTMALTTAGYCVLGPDDVCCVLTPEFQQYLSQYREIPEKTAEKIYYSVPCQEPETETECRDAAVLCVTEWLKDCGKEGTDPRYRNHGFTIAEEGKNNFRAGGYVDGRKEFLVEVCFTAEYDEDAGFYSSHEIAHYTEAGTFWEGVYLRARFCWEDGMVSLLDPMGSDLYLDGFQTSEYRDFFDYARRSDLLDSGNSRILEVQLEKGEADQEFLLTVKNLGRESVELENIQFSQLREDGYGVCFLAPGKLNLEEGLQGAEEEIDLKFAAGESREIPLENQMLMLMNDEILEMFYEQIQKYRGELEDLEELETLGITADSAYEEFAAALRKQVMVDEETTLLVEIQYRLGENEMLTRVKFNLGQGAE